MGFFDSLKQPGTAWFRAVSLSKTRFVLKMQNPQRTRLRIIAKRREKMKKKKLSIFIVPGNYEEKKG